MELLPLVTSRGALAIGSVVAKSNMTKLLASLLSLAASAYFPGTGFLLYLLYQDRLGKYKRFTLVALVAVQFIHIIAFLGTAYGPLISHVGPSVTE